MKIYTKTGDAGETSLYDGKRVKKDSLRVEAYGTVDELNSHIGLARSFVEDLEISEMLLSIQKRLFFVAGELATINSEKVKYYVTENDVETLEKWIDEFLKKIEDIDAFIIPGTSSSSSMLHVARTVCRRAERRILSLSRQYDVRPELIKFINRLSDTLYAFARYLESELIIIDFEKIYNEKM